MICIDVSASKFDHELIVSAGLQSADVDTCVELGDVVAGTSVVCVPIIASAGVQQQIITITTGNAGGDICANAGIAAYELNVSFILACTTERGDICYLSVTDGCLITIDGKYITVLSEDERQLQL